MEQEELGQLAGKSRPWGPECVIITGVNQGGYIMNVVAESDSFPRTRRVGHERPGTGCILLRGVGGCRRMESGQRCASGRLICKACIARSEELDIPIANGVCFEELMDVLVRAVIRRHEAAWYARWIA